MTETIAVDEQKLVDDVAFLIMTKLAIKLALENDFDRARKEIALDIIADYAYTAGLALINARRRIIG